MREGQKRDVARALRRNATATEAAMWRLLRDRRFCGIKFRRQVPIGPFIADFASIEHRLVIELDGSQHADSVSDRARDADLASNGWQVLRFWNNEVLSNRNGVLECIFEAVDRTLTRPPTAGALSRARERG